MKNLKILSETFKHYREKVIIDRDAMTGVMVEQRLPIPSTGILIDLHHGFVKFSPAEWFTPEKESVGDKVINKRDVHKSLVLAKAEATKLGFNKPRFQFGINTHKVKIVSELGRARVLLDVEGTSLPSLQRLQEEYNCSELPLGRLPYKSPQFFEALTEASQHAKHIKLSTLYSRKRDSAPRVSVIMAFNDLVLGVESTPDVMMHDEEVTIHISPQSPRVETDLDL